MGTPAGVVTWSLSPSISYAAEGGGLGGASLSSFMPAGFKAEIIAAFAQWSAVADITFVEVPDSGTAFNAAGATGDIRIGAHTFDGPGGSSAHAYFPPVQGTSAASDIHFDLADSWKIGFGGTGFDIQQVAAHEIGHAIGLGHSPVPGSLMNTIYTETFSGVQADDIAGAIAIYGAAPPAVPEPGSLVLFALRSWRPRPGRVRNPTSQKKSHHRNPRLIVVGHLNDAQSQVAVG